ncbi:MAG: acyl CoA--acetate/3-ketoacid CoA transferase subunit alpha [Pseudomonadales bacterium]|jgi:glutaconate CoA-transferase, subunit A|nr:acyl CoA--acetate/3-ketoacid CoA transferase subunit alpha [Pseudomonadales bacterium]TNC84152.1 MAG: acyl CoA--acetate/3-ketoacid CoA transferase subunit alpha [Alcanivorax sp.]HAG97203.1 acyl CoA--acetate/3-ketoacid CoA transferase subunit alpha [Gammaproteobacteria bacterium]MAQ26016.1 acyl CoA--acetate/3-ketoacid CoA transferase subunit alpha [Pseudomonadales bacterium]MBI25545.1 acyl CoA--acetate/3-ketoacid CoA transferase subunit alpha [Pseudomonadales bacterium]|tara:strand:+ start:6436 stop:7311 length:876 start_codon:yes stop_codon:yes gene_type:complete
MNKVQSAQEAVSQIKSGMTIGIGGWGPRRKPMALIRELLRSDVQDLTLVSYGGADVGMLCAAGKVRKVVYAFVSLDFIPLEPYFRLARQQGDIEVMELDEGLMLLGLRAAAWRLPYIPTAIGLGTDVIRHCPDLKVIDSPYDDKEWLAMPALNLDVSLLHVDRADARGVCQIKGPDLYMDDWFARAANSTLVSCEELVETDYFHAGDEARYVFWERAQTQAVVPIAGGAHPSSCNPEYGFDVNHFKAYAASVKEGGFDAYRSRFLSGTDEQDYQQAVGGLEAIQALPLPVY